MESVTLNTKRLEKERVMREMSQDEFARALGFKRPSSYTYLMKKKSTTFKSLAKMAQALNMRPKDLLL
jgi:transcriptional regulator with XRE-family HTH domain